MPTVQELRDRVVRLKIERADNNADLCEINARLDNQKTLPAKLGELKARRATLAADNASIDAELTQLHARLSSADQLESERIRRLDGIREFACSIIRRGVPPEIPPSDVIASAARLEAALQHAVPPVVIPDLPDDENTDH